MKLFSNFAGQKEAYGMPFGKIDIYLDPFVGNGGGLGNAIAQGVKTAWIAEKEPALRYLWQALIDGNVESLTESLHREIDDLSLESNDKCLAHITELWSGTIEQRLAARLFLSVVGFNGLSRTRRDNPDELWICVYPWPTEGALAKNPNAQGRLKGETPDEKRGDLRRRLQKDFVNWGEISASLKPIDIQLFDDSYDLLEALPSLPQGRVGALIDPPYYVNPLDGYKPITASYPGHQPHELYTWHLCADAIDGIFRVADIVYVTNYQSTQLTMLMAGWGCRQIGGPKLLKQCGYHARQALTSESGKRHRRRPAAPEIVYCYRRRRFSAMLDGQLSFC